MLIEVKIPADHPMMKAWNKYKDTEEYSNSRYWAVHGDHVDGSMWAAFCAGYKSSQDST